MRAFASRFGPWALIFGYLFRFAGNGVWARFTSNDLMNLKFHLTPSFGHLALGNLTFWSTMYRPFGGVVYAAIYHLFGFHPLPFRVVCFALVAGNLVLVYRVSMRLTESREVALVATLLVSYHAWLVDIYYSSGTIYELLCFALYFAAFDYYLGVRGTGRMLGWRQGAVFLALYIGALDSKELAVTLPLSLGCYELLWHRPAGGVRGYARWLAREGRGMLLSGLLTVAYVIGKLTGPDSLAAIPSYRPRISLMGYLHAFHLYLNVLFYQEHVFRAGNTALLLAAMLAAAVWLRSRPLLFAWLFVLFSVLPFIFIPHYDGFFIYLPMAGWAVYAATVLVMLRRRAGRAIAPVVLLVAVAVVLAPLHTRQSRKTMRVFASAAEPTEEMMAELGRVQPAVPRGAHLFFEDDPFPVRSYSLLFLVQLFYHDLTIDVARAKDGAAEEGRRYDAVLRWEGGRLVRATMGPE